jgi:hypothetical protein
MTLTFPLILVYLLSSIFETSTSKQQQQQQQQHQHQHQDIFVMKRVKNGNDNALFKQQRNR